MSAGEVASVTVYCPRCGWLFRMAVETLRVGYAVHVEAAGCDCDLTEAEYEALVDRAVEAYEVTERGG